MRQRELTTRQQRLLNALRVLAEEKGYPPTLRELMEPSGLATPSAVAYQLRELELKGYVRRAPGIPRGLVVNPEDVAQRSGGVA
jgi:repressor LexA